MPVIQAQDVVNSVIQDSQSQTTNRTALYDYLDRIHQRILRESQWRFLLSDPQTFVTMPGVASYTLVDGTPPPGSFQTQNMLTDFANIAPGSVFDLTTWTKIEEDSDSQTTLNYFIYRDGSLRYGCPRTYENLISSPGTIILKPVPDAQNLYYPVPETPEVTYFLGGSLPARIYYGVITFVDSLNGESTQCVIPFTIAVPAGYLVTVHSPNPTLGGISGNQVVYGWWNVYIGMSLNNYYRQNTTSIPIGTDWTESVLGINIGALQIPSMGPLPPATSNTFLEILPTGQLTTTTGDSPYIPALWEISDSNGAWWEVTVQTSPPYMLETVSVPVNRNNTTNVFPAIYLTDSGNVSTWKITVTTSGQLEANVFSTPPTTATINGQPPTTTTIQPLNAYVIQFRYYQTRNQITSANPTQILQIPYAYRDIVIAGVNYLAALYANRNEIVEPPYKIGMWKRDFEQGLAQIRRDLRISYRKTDFIAPDQVSQYVVGNQQGIPTMGW